MSDLKTLPWPFPDEDRTFRYGVNVQPAPRLTTTLAGEWGEHVVDLGDDYLYMMQLRRDILDRDPGRAQMLPHMMPACWDVMLFLMRQLAASYPASMLLEGKGNHYRWTNRLLGIEQSFTLGDLFTLPEDPLTFIGCQVPDDILLLTERDDQLWFDAALVTSSADWSVKFDIGMSFDEIHVPVPGLTAGGVTGRAQSFMRMLTTDQIYRRVNWTFSAVGSRLRDTSLETMPQWMHDMPELISQKDWGRIQLRIELEHLIRLPLTGALVFNIRTYLAPLSDIAAIPQWAEQLAAIVTELPQEIAEYKGIDGYRVEAMKWLRAQSEVLAATG
ncbi:MULTISPECIES: DUF3445 domain-containing protein [unclassified Rhodococcus (in: high G+C Gram-positive bacteria)]|uniref:heme-dependent oxidative N-demethylase family protein n=1 Tax=unclassified Rhodococcus (in: high G+C Gram-positive bacteria) TaxID=192944 RepID=UPI0005D371C3|nr:MULTISPECIES: DUF3445 domain-containing protein [unclassified Rhodococcus (in: high G+C Gram-positive bacteria)]KJF24424.1 hypothetical protein SZ00_01345 [Rhodococcus sp. AD45]